MRPGLHVASILLSLATISALCGQEWTWFRGPNGTGVSDCKTIPVQWSQSDYRWTVKLPGTGYSSPVVWEDRVFVFSADPETARRHVSCYGANDGKQLWVRDFVSQPHRLHQRNSYASGTPTVDSERVYVAWATPAELTVKAFSHDGQEVWSRDLGMWIGDHGFGGSPILYEGLLILHNAQQAQELEPDEKPGQAPWSLSTAGLERTSGRRCCPPSAPAIQCRSSSSPKRAPPKWFVRAPAMASSAWIRKRASNAGPPRSLTCVSLTRRSPPADSIFGNNGTGGYSGNYLVAVRPALSRNWPTS